MVKRISLDIGILREVLSCDYETGKLFWKKRPLHMFANEKRMNEWNTRYSNKEAFISNINGYMRGKIFGVAYSAHRVIWALYYDKWPGPYIDHINGIKDDNRISNLREATNRENLRNRGRPSTNKSGYKGVSFHKRSKRYQANIMTNKGRKNLGYFDCPKEAYAVYCKAAKKYHGEFANLD